MSEARTQELVELLLAGDLSANQRDELRHLVESDDELGCEIADQMHLEPLLRDAFHDDPNDFAARLTESLDSERLDGDLFSQRVLDAWTEDRAKRSRRRTLAVTACLSAAVVFSLFMIPPFKNGKTQPLLQLQYAVGTVQAVDSRGVARTLTAGAELGLGETIVTRGESAATLTTAGGWRVTMTRDASLTTIDSKTGDLRLNTGLARVENSGRLPLTPVRLTTSHATIEAPSSEFLLATSEHRTDVTIHQGTALVSHRRSEPIEISSGESSIATSETVELRRGLATSDSWSIDFEEGMPVGWQGTFVESDLPDGSRGAIQTTQLETEDGDSCHQLWSPSVWQHGLAVVHPDTCLNFVYRLKTADTVQLLTLLRSPLGDSANHQVHVLQPADIPVEERWWDVPANQWYTVSIPLARMTNPVSLKRPAHSHIVTAFNFRAQNHACRLAIDHMWVSRKKSDRIEFKPIEVDPR